LLFLLLAMMAGCRPGSRLGIPDDGSVVRMVYFYSLDCTHCRVIQEEVLQPLQAEYEDRIQIRWVEISAPENYELLIRTEEHFRIAPQERGLPTLVVGEQVLIGEEQIRRDLSCLLESCFAAGGTTWPNVLGMTGSSPAAPGSPLAGPGVGPDTGLAIICEEEAAVACERPTEIWAAYFYQVGCSACSRAEADIRYVRSRYPELIVEPFNIYDDLPLAQWLARRVGREGDLHTPALFIGDDALIGEEEITPQSLEALVAKYAPTGADQVWTAAEAVAPAGVGLLTVVLAGLVDGLNPCAFATLIFFISYLAAGERKGRQVLAAGGAFTLGVFLAYLAVGLGLYRALDLLQDRVPFATELSRWVYGLTALFCAILAVFSFSDFLKARRGQTEEMSLSLSAGLRQRIRAVIRAGQRARLFVLATFGTGVVISLLELACTGQIYLPTIIYMVSDPGLRARGVLYLLLYNLVFILPLVVVFVLVYLGASSFQLGLFLKRRAALVKLAMTAVFAALAAWLMFALVLR